MRYILLCGLLLCVPQIVAATPLSVNWTGHTAQLFDSPGYLEPGHGAGGNPHFGGPAAMNIQGHAFQFSVSERTFLQYSTMDASLVDFDGQCGPSSYSCDGLTSWFTAIVYDHTIDHEYWGVIPVGNSIATSSRQAITGIGGHTAVPSCELSIWLDPGTYWLGIEGYGELTYFSNVSLIGHVEVPEPASVILLALGLPLLGCKRKGMNKM